jgi:hypothetical protein
VRSQQALDRLFRYCQEYDIILGPGTQAALEEYYGGGSSSMLAEPQQHQEGGYRAELGR